jgi:RNA polymerase sigma-70 factor (ECF subfamily)
MLGNEADAVDAAQDALLSVVRSITRFDGRSSFGTWIYRIATNACLDELRRRRRRPVVGIPGEAEDDADGGRAFGSGGRDPADEATAHVDVDAALRRLAPEHRVAVVLRDVCDLTYEEIAVVLDVPVGTVRSRIARGRGALADQMTGTRGYEAGPAAGPEAGNRAGDGNVKPGDRTENHTP